MDGIRFLVMLAVWFFSYGILLDRYHKSLKAIANDNHVIRERLAAIIEHFDIEMYPEEQPDDEEN